jgi:hypothetical protein
MRLTERSVTRHKWIALLVFRGVKNREVFAAASRDGFTAARKTSNDPRPSGPLLSFWLVKTPSRTVKIDARTVSESVACFPERTKQRSSHATRRVCHGRNACVTRVARKATLGLSGARTAKLNGRTGLARSRDFRSARVSSRPRLRMTLHHVMVQSARYGVQQHRHLDRL